ncbi:hypothetical protein F9B85_05000 [Heliorestis acidaminivorans]|uniref:Uncharacterized protein n=1 Tax=Heliorestis acidaminivorans TaxID=553427 RepID=A0A6I0F3X8_9FIRM|nr:hypothetical protein [Heliorestis acidaminivorans]KAB2953272.1 hypothetical protein F9B85_05000 [Heliorestis acidaminivorans]
MNQYGQMLDYMLTRLQESGKAINKLITSDNRYREAVIQSKENSESTIKITLTSGDTLEIDTDAINKLTFNGSLVVSDFEEFQDLYDSLKKSLYYDMHFEGSVGTVLDVIYDIKDTYVSVSGDW